MGYSSSDSDNDRKSRRHKKRRYLSSRDGSSDRERDRKFKNTKHRRRSHSRSRSHSSDRHRSSERSHKRHSRHHSRSRSRSHSRTVSSDRNSRSKSSKSNRKSDSRSRESSKVKELKHGKKESPGWYKTESSSPYGDSSQTNAQHSEKMLQKALQAAVNTDEILKAQGVVLDDNRVHVKTETASFSEQQRRASAIQDIESSDFVQSTFRSSRSEIPLPTGSIVDASHSGAMFGSLNATAPVVGAVSHNGPSAAAGLPDDDALMHPNLFVSAEEKMEQWKRKLVQLRKRKLENCV